MTVLYAIVLRSRAVAAEEVQAEVEPDEPESFSAERGYFKPPLYLQRYFAVINLLKREKWVAHINKVKKGEGN